MRAQGTERQPQRRRPRSLGVATWLLVLALVPLCGTGAFVAAEMRRVTQVQAHARAIDASVRNVVVLNELRAALLDERNWVAASTAIDDLGIDEQIVEELLGFNVADSRTAAVARVDDLLAQSKDPVLQTRTHDVRTAVAGMGESSAMSEAYAMGDVYETLEMAMADTSQRAVDELLVIAGDIGGGSDLIDVLRILESATVARQAVTSQVTEYFALEFSGTPGTDTGLDELIEQREVYVLAMAQIERVEEPGSRVASARASITTSDEVRSFDASVARLTNSLLAVGLTSDAAIAASNTVEDLGPIFLAGVASSDQHLELIDAAAGDVTDVSTDLIREADDDLRAVATRIAVVGLLSIACVGLLARVIGRPLRDLANAARRLRDGDTSASLRPAGPSEVREAAQAISEAAGHLQLAEQQAKALAQGAFEHPVLAEEAPGELGASLQDALQTLVTSLSDREEFRRLLAHEATHDALTQLANRRAVMARLNESLARTRRTGSSLAVMFLDLDDFKDVNDRHGHLVGDAVLRTVSQRLLLALRQGDHVGRLGGDEFLIVAEPVSGYREALGLAERLLDSVRLPISHRTGLLAISASIGIAMVDEETVLNAEEVLRDADLAVYQAKSKGRAQIELCDDDLRSELERRTLLEESIRGALDRGQLRLHYQPIVDPSTGADFAFEALIRWDHPTDGTVGPDRFIPFAERSDLILDIDRWVVAEAARQLRAWSSVEALANVPISINISGRHLGAPRFVESILGPFAAEGVDCSRLIIEVTESAVLEDLDAAAHKLQELRTAGARIAIDDFGTGYTSLAHLRTLPIDILKIDRSFTVDPNASSLVQLIIDTGHLLDVRITAEGVETIDQATALTRMGADELQGYLYARPMSPEHLELRGRAAPLPRSGTSVNPLPS